MNSTEPVTEENFERVYKGYSLKYDKPESGVFCHLLRLEFSGKEIINYLEKKGYIIYAHKAVGEVTYRLYNMGGECETQYYGNDFVERVVAVKDKSELPAFWASTQHGSYIFPSIIQTFTKELKNTLLNL